MNQKTAGYGAAHHELVIDTPKVEGVFFPQCSHTGRVERKRRTSRFVNILSLFPRVFFVFSSQPSKDNGGCLVVVVDGVFLPYRKEKMKPLDSAIRFG